MATLANDSCSFIRKTAYEVYQKMSPKEWKEFGGSVTFTKDEIGKWDVIRKFMEKCVETDSLAEESKPKVDTLEDVVNEEVKKLL